MYKVMPALLGPGGFLKKFNDVLSEKYPGVALGQGADGKLTIETPKKSSLSSKPTPRSGRRRTRGQMLLSRTRKNAAQGIKD